MLTNIGSNLGDALDYNNPTPVVADALKPNHSHHEIFDSHRAEVLFGSRCDIILIYLDVTHASRLSGDEEGATE